MVEGEGWLGVGSGGSGGSQKKSWEVYGPLDPVGVFFFFLQGVVQGKVP